MLKYFSFVQLYIAENIKGMMTVASEQQGICNITKRFMTMTNYDLL